MIESLQPSYEIGNTTKTADSVMRPYLLFPHVTSRLLAFFPRAQLMIDMLQRFFCHGNGVED